MDTKAGYSTRKKPKVTTQTRIRVNLRTRYAQVHQNVRIYTGNKDTQE